MFNAICLLFLCVSGIFCSSSLNLFQMFDGALCRSKCLQEVMNLDQECDFHPCNCSNAKEGTKWDSLDFTNHPSPDLLCRSEHSLKFKWKARNLTTYFVETKKEKLSWQIYKKWTSCGKLSVENLQPDTSYEVRIWGISSEGKVYRTSPVHVRTLSNRTSPLPVRSLKVKELLLIEDHYDAIINWTPAKDLHCSYAIVTYSTSGSDYLQEIDIDEPPPSYEVRLHSLSFGETYKVEIATKVEIESAKTYCNVVVPTCLESYNNLTVCEPDPPLNVSTTEKCHLNSEEAFVCSVTVTWAEPELIPEEYIVNLINFKTHETENSTRIQLNVPGNATSAVIIGVELEAHYEVILKAFSPAGSSAPAVFYKQFSPLRFRQRLWSPFEAIPIALAFIASLSLVIILLFVYKRKQIKQTRIQMNNLYLEDLKRKCLNSEEPINLKIDHDYENRERDEWELDYLQLAVEAVLGEGAFGVVKKGILLKSEYDEKTDVAIKMLKESPTIDEVRQFHQEIQIMKSVGSHPNIVSLIGCITSDKLKSPLLVVEYCAKGDLQSFLRKEWASITNSAYEVSSGNPGCEDGVHQVFNKSYDVADLLHPVDLLSFARQIAMGMEYLSNLRVIHRDLAARNVLVCDNKIVKVSDFGLSRDVYQDNVYCKISGGKLPIRWMAIESLTHQRYTTQSDVWSFGVLLWEIVTLGEHPYPDVNTFNLLERLKSGYRMQCPENCNQQLYRMMLDCWNENPKDRPTFRELRENLEKYLEDVTAYVTVKQINQKAQSDDYDMNSTALYSCD